MADMIDRPQRAMVVFAHPDDEIGCAGTIARWIKNGTEVCLVLCTNGDKGTEDMTITPEHLARIRAEEQRAAAEALGVKDLVMLGFPDGELEDTREFRGKVVREIRRFRPDVVLTHAPVAITRHNHRDHRMTGVVTLDAVYPYARDPWHFVEVTQEGFQPHKVATVLMWGGDSPDIFSDITDTIDQKADAMMHHHSQFGRPNRDPNRRPGDFLREGAKRQGERAGMNFAEAFSKLEFRV